MITSMLHYATNVHGLEAFYTRVQSGWQLKANLYRQLFVQSLVDCCAKCGQDDECHGVLFNANGACLLGNHSTAPVATPLFTGGTYYQRDRPNGKKTLKGKTDVSFLTQSNGLSLPMQRQFSPKAQVRKDFGKPSKSCHVGIHRIALAEYSSQTSTHLPEFQFFLFLEFRIILYWRN